MNITIPMLGLERNGGNRVLMAIANQLVERGHTCEIITPKRHEQQPGFTLNELVKIREITPALSIKSLRWLVFILACCWKLRNKKVLANHFLTAASARIAAALSSTKIVYLVQDIEYRFYPLPVSWIMKPVCRFTYGIRRVIPANPYLEKELTRIGVNTMPALKLGITSEFLKTPNRKQAKAYDVACFIRRGRHKRMDRFAAIANGLKRYGVSIVGIAPRQDLLEKFKNILDAGMVPESDQAIISILDQSKILLLPSDHEGFSLPPLEAMARGLPVVLFACGGPEIYARHKYNALIASDQRIETAIESVLSLLRNNDDYSEYSRNASATARQFNLDEAIIDFGVQLEDYFNTY